MFSAELKCLRKSGICQKFLPETLEICWAEFVYSVQCESKKFPPKVFWHFFANGVEFLDQILHTYYTFLSALDYKFLSNYVQFWRSYAIVSATTQFTPYVQNVHHRPKRTLAFSDIFPKQLRIFGPNFTHLLCIPIYARLRVYRLLWRSYAILSVTTQFTSCAQNIHHRPKRRLEFSDIFP